MAPDGITIRLLAEQDIAACVPLYQAAYETPPYGHGWDSETSARIIADIRRLFPQECFVAEKEGVVLGFILCSCLAGLRAMVEEFVVDPRWQKRGVGRALLTHIITLFRARGVPYLELIANTEAPAYRFYRREGFSETDNYRLMSKPL